MARTHASLLLMFLLSMSVFELGAKGCYLDTTGGGCPDASKCLVTCSTCFVGFGKVEAACVAPGAGTPTWVCRCFFLDGAPCPPSGYPRCPGPPHTPLVLN